MSRIAGTFAGDGGANGGGIGGGWSAIANPRRTFSKDPGVVGTFNVFIVASIAGTLTELASTLAN